MNEPYSLTQKANFPDSDDAAMAELAAAVGIMMDFLDGAVRDLNVEEEVINLWDIARGFQSASELYFIGKASA